MGISSLKLFPRIVTSILVAGSVIFGKSDRQGSATLAIVYMEIYIKKTILNSLKAVSEQAEYPDDEKLIIYFDTNILAIKHRDMVGLQIYYVENNHNELIYWLQGCSYYLGGSRRKNPLEIAQEINSAVYGLLSRLGIPPTSNL